MKKNNLTGPVPDLNASIKACPTISRADTAAHRSGTVMHIALQGLLKAGAIPYGLTADTGGHIRYLLELVDALAERPEVERQIIVTRAFDDARFGSEYFNREEKLSENISLWRCQGESTAYLPKEELWDELPALSRELLQRMIQQQIFPDFIQAHYADAGIIAKQIKAATGIPYAFTAHSLGALKAQHRSGKPIDETLTRRIRQEEDAIKGASTLIASSRHEAFHQYGLYKNATADRIAVNPPGCALRDFYRPARASLARETDAELRRYLREPDRPCLLAIARPVEKKNLSALVTAYGEDAELRKSANLVIYAGSRGDIEAGEPEARKVWQNILYLIDYYDLYGSVAYPKQHRMSHIPAIYQWAARRHGIFVNPALNEPFGLTLLEAAAAGLPVVATREGGPVDIIERCHHGLLISPTDTKALARACCQLLANPLNWKRFSAQGQENVSFYTWARHARQYVEDMGLGSARRAVRAPLHFSRMLATDMDGTLFGAPFGKDEGSGESEGLKKLGAWLMAKPSCLYVVATGRSLSAALRELRRWKAPLPHFLIADVGSSIYRLEASGRPEALPQWHDELNKDWDRAACMQLLNALPFLKLQPERVQSLHKLSYFSDEQPQASASISGFDGPDVAHKISLVKEKLAQAGLKARVIHSHGHLLDILPENSGKAHAVECLRAMFSVNASQVIAAGDSGNDEDLLRYAGAGIVVGNHTRELEALRTFSSVYWAKEAYVNGLLEGLRHWEALHSVPVAAPGKHPTVLSGQSRDRDENGKQGVKSVGGGA